jgi:lipoprotein-anchoring transpeptidase ErfK/SrfK
MTEPTTRAELRSRRGARRLRIIVGSLVLVLILAVGGVFFASQGGDAKKAVARPATTPPTTLAPTTTTTLPPAPRAAITAGGDIQVYAAPNDPKPEATLSAVTSYGFPRTVLAFDQQQDWLHVSLPTRPNGSTGWIKASDVVLSQPLLISIKISLANHTLSVLKGNTVVFTKPAAVGTAENPTPTGSFYFTDPLNLADDTSGPYGAFAIGLSAHSNTLSEFGGGDAEIAIHGTNDPSTIGQSVSHGCVRVNNDVILVLSKLPLGTPVVIT